MKFKKGLDLPITGAPVQDIHDGPAIRTVAVNGQDFIGLKPKMLVAEGETVKLGQPLFVHKESPEIQYVSPGGGTVRAINRGARRVLETIEIELAETEEAVSFDAHRAEDLATLTRESAQANLYASGLWTSFKTRPYSKVPAAGTSPHSIFVTAMDTEPLAADAAMIIQRSGEDFANGLKILTRLTDGSVFVCHGDGQSLPGQDVGQTVFRSFSGPHPAGLAGTHIHFLDPIHGEKVVWTINYQDVIAIGRLFTTGLLNVERVISIAGPLASNPRLVTTRMGASTEDLCANERVPHQPCRTISGSVLTGREALGQFAFLGRYHRQVTLMLEDTQQTVLGWLKPSRKRFSFSNVHLSSFFRSKKFGLGTNLNGAHRAMVPFGSYERVMPLDLLPTQLLRALLVLDTDSAQKLGALELDEEDLALCSFICHSKYEYGEALRASLNKIEKEG